MNNPEQTGLKGAGLAVAKFLWAWAHDDPESMYEVCQKSWTSRYEVGSVVPVEGVVNDFGKITTLRYAEHHHIVTAWIVLDNEEYEATMNVIQETAAYTPSPEGEWGINPISFRVRRPTW
jgi:hypothetical protein